MVVIFFIFLIIQFPNSLNNTDENIEGFLQFHQAIMAASNGEFLKARDVFKKEVPELRFREDANLFLQICNDVINKKLKKEAGEYLFKSINTVYLHPNTSEELFYLNRAFGLQRDYALTYIFRGKFYSKQEKYEFALREFSTAIKYSRKYKWIYYFRGKVYRLLKNFKNAYNDFTISIDLDPGFAEAFIARANTSLDQEKMDMALADFKMAGKIDMAYLKKKGYGGVINNIGIEYKKRNEHNKAIDAFSESILSNKHTYWPYLNRGIAYRLIEKYDFALADFDKAVELKPNNPEAYYNRGLTYKKTYNIENAILDLNTATHLDENYEKAYTALAEIYLDSKLLAKAVFNFNKVLEINPKDYWTFYRIAQAYDKFKKYDKAIIYYNKFLNLVPDKHFRHKISSQNRVKKLQKYQTNKSRES